MYDMVNILSETWEVKFIDGNILHILPPKLIDRYKINDYINNVEKDYQSCMVKCISTIINNNKEKLVYNENKLKELLTEEDMIDFIDHFNRWISEVLDKKN